MHTDRQACSDVAPAHTATSTRHITDSDWRFSHAVGILFALVHPGATIDTTPTGIRFSIVFSFLQVAYFVNSGSEANDMAILLARLYTGNHDLIALRNGYHGITEGLLGVLGHSTWKYNVPSVRHSVMYVLVKHYICIVGTILYSDMYVSECVALRSGNARYEM